MEKHLVVLIFSVIFVIIRAEDCGKLSSGSISDKATNLPWAVQLREKSSNDIVCTGTLISNQHALFGKQTVSIFDITRGHIENNNESDIDLCWLRFFSCLTTYSCFLVFSCLLLVAKALFRCFEGQR